MSDGTSDDIMMCPIKDILSCLPFWRVLFQRKISLNKFSSLRMEGEYVYICISETGYK